MWETLRKFVTNPTVQGVLVAAAMALLKEIVNELNADATNSQ